MGVPANASQRYILLFTGVPTRVSTGWVRGLGFRIGEFVRV